MLTWKALELDKFIRQVLLSVGKLIAQEALSLLIGGVGEVAILAKIAIWIAQAKTVAYDIVFKEVKEQLEIVRKNAKLTGKLLACCLVLEHPRRFRRVSIVGVGCGCQVVKSCIRQLQRLKALDILDKVSFIGGAITEKGIPIGLRIKNLHSKSDHFLTFLQLLNKGKKWVGKSEMAGVENILVEKTSYEK